MLTQHMLHYSNTTLSDYTSITLYMLCRRPSDRATEPHTTIQEPKRTAGHRNRLNLEPNRTEPNRTEPFLLYHCVILE